MSAGDSASVGWAPGSVPYPLADPSRKLEGFFSYFAGISIETKSPVKPALAR